MRKYLYFTFYFFPMMIFGIGSYLFGLVIQSSQKYEIDLSLKIISIFLMTIGLIYIMYTSKNMADIKVSQDALDEESVK